MHNFYIDSDYVPPVDAFEGPRGDDLPIPTPCAEMLFQPTWPREDLRQTVPLKAYPGYAIDTWGVVYKLTSTRPQYKRQATWEALPERKKYSASKRMQSVLRLPHGKQRSRPLPPTATNWLAPEGWRPHAFSDVGYLCVRLRVDGHRQLVRLAELMWDTFAPMPRLEHEVIFHRNLDVTDCRCENLLAARPETADTYRSKLRAIAITGVEKRLAPPWVYKPVNPKAPRSPSPKAADQMILLTGQGILSRREIAQAFGVTPYLVAQFIKQRKTRTMLTVARAEQIDQRYCRAAALVATRMDDLEAGATPEFTIEQIRAATQMDGHQFTRAMLKELGTAERARRAAEQPLLLTMTAYVEKWQDHKQKEQERANRTPGYEPRPLQTKEPYP